ncbi:MAG: phospholipid carrier-dependent glycosyltransferase [Microbacteriaceae bacterium]|nr:phospholipid carrier-dependent glycosyltransferase [Microbacteriaceae bacterium]
MTQATPASAQQRTGAHRLAPPGGSWADDLWARATATPARRRRLEWAIVAVLTLVAAAIRFIRLGDPHRLVFDEVYYVLDSWTLVNEGYEARFPDEGGREAFAAGDVGAYDPEQPAYVVHPPFGKLLIGWGMQLLGPEHAYAWRAAVALLGTLAVPLLYLVGRRLFGSIALAAIAAGFLAIDGHAIATSRISILDGLLMFFVLLGTLFLLLDREQQRRQMLAWPERWRAKHGPGTPLIGGPVLLARPWLVAMAVALALATGIKWSGAVWLAAYCLLSLGFDAAARREAGIQGWLPAALLGQSWASFLLTIPLAIAVYIATWWGWLSTSGGYYRQWAANPDHAWDAPLSWVPAPLQSLWHYHAQAFGFHGGLHGDHPYISPAYEWPFLLRPTAFSYEYTTGAETPACLADRCVTAITSLSNPLIFWLGTIAIVFVLLYAFVRPNWRYAVLLVGYGAGWLPWLVTGRTSIYHFYVIAWLPFMLLAAAFALQVIAGSPRDDRRQRGPIMTVLAAFLGLVALVSLWFGPVWTGVLIPEWYWSTTHWLPGWK